QAELANYKAEIRVLRLNQSVNLAVVKENADMALQNLLTVLAASDSSIKQLISGVASLQLVADLLKLISKLSETVEDKD
ncbi:SDCG3 protein, partial [Crotophaga sulcirostris]|nr:SDCG3 protein [Crotophaga sulcirostris]